VHFVSEFAICSAPSQRTDKAGESDVLTSALWCIAAHQSIVWTKVRDRTDTPEDCFHTTTLKCEVKGEKEDEENERRIYLKDRRDTRA